MIGTNNVISVECFHLLRKYAPVKVRYGSSKHGHRRNRKKEV